MVGSLAAAPAALAEPKTPNAATARVCGALNEQVKGSVCEVTQTNLFSLDGASLDEREAAAMGAARKMQLHLAPNEMAVCDAKKPNLYAQCEVVPRTGVNVSDCVTITNDSIVKCAGERGDEDVRVK
ncbi:hypothetical protein KA119_02370 [Candidatus Gracilibacteria bacterium]|nr:hypothetical protein [Candidatus Gracilibacteria bacterium]